MRDGTRQWLRIACLILAGLLVFQIAWTAAELRPLSLVKIPELPSLPPEATNLSAMSAPGSAGPARGTNRTAPAAVTNAMTNAIARGTNVPATNAPAGSNAPLSTPIINATNAHDATSATNAYVVMAPPPLNGSNFSIEAPSGTNGSNATLAAGLTNRASTNMAGARGPNAGLARGGIPAAGLPMMMSGVKPAALPPVVQAKVSRVIDSELLGTVMHPQPMALLGIAGNYAMLRTPSGQTGLVKEGDELGGVKLLTIGVNRVLVEEQGKTNELTIFSGFGGESLLPKQDKHETNSTVGP